MSINSVTISGNLTHDPALRATPAGQNVLNFGMAVNDRRKNPQTGEWEDYPNFIDCTMFGNRAESMSRILHKGLKVCVKGRLHYSSWEKDGQKRSKVDVTVEDIDLMQQRQDGQQRPQQQAQSYLQGVQPIQQQPAQQYQQQVQQQPAQQQYQSQQDFYDDSIPF